MSGATHSKDKQPIAIKIIALLSIVRWYNILLTVFAEYLSAYVLMRADSNTFSLLLGDWKLHAIVVSSIFSIAGGFIINNFYDYEKDLINRPDSTLFNKSISKKTTLNFYIAFNVIAVLIACLASLKIGLFFIGFISALWVYSHKLQRLSFIKELAASALSITCFFAVLLHYSKFYPYIFIYGAFYISLVYGRELVKQFINFTGDKVLNIQSLPVSLGVDKAKSFLNFVIVLSVAGGLGILLNDGLMLRNYFILFTLFCLVSVLTLTKYNKYKSANAVYKVLLVAGIVNFLWM